MKWLSPQPSTPCLCRYSSLHRPLAISSLSWRTAVPSHAVPLEHRRLPSTPGHVGRLRLRLTRRRADGGHGSSSDARNTASVAAQEGGDGTGRGPWVDGAHGANPEILRDVMRRKTTQAPAFDTRAAMNQLWVVWGICCFVEVRRFYCSQTSLSLLLLPRPPSSRSAPALSILFASLRPIAAGLAFRYMPRHERHGGRLPSHRDLRVPSASGGAPLRPRCGQDHGQDVESGIADAYPRSAEPPGEERAGVQHLS